VEIGHENGFIGGLSFFRVTLKEHFSFKTKKKVSAFLPHIISQYKTISFFTIWCVWQFTTHYMGYAK